MRSPLLQLGRSWALLPLALVAAGCNATTTTRSQPAAGAAEMQPGGARAAHEAIPGEFTFSVPAGTRYVWTARRTFRARLATTGVEERDDTELRWNVTAHPSLYGSTVFDADLVSVRASHDGATVVDGQPAGARVELVVDSGGNLEEVRGVEQTSRAIVALADPDARSRAERVFSPEDLRTLLRARHDLLLGDIVFRPTRPGTTWIIPPRFDGDARLRRYTVDRMESCDGGGACALLRVGVWLDPRTVDRVARALVARHLAATGGQEAPGGDGASLQVRESRYSMTGTVLVDPATLLEHGAKTTETGRAVVVGPDGKAHEVDVRGRTEDTFDYGAEQR